MAYALPPWLAPVNPVPYAVQGFQQGESIAERQNRAELAIQEMTLRREQQQRLQEQANQEMAIRNQQAAEQAKQAALKWQWQQELSGRVAQGEDPMKAWEATSTKYNPAGMAPYWARKAATEVQAKKAEAAAARQATPPEVKEFGGEKFLTFEGPTGQPHYQHIQRPPSVMSDIDYRDITEDIRSLSSQLAKEQETERKYRAAGVKVSDQTAASINDLKNQIEAKKISRRKLFPNAPKDELDSGSPVIPDMAKTMIQQYPELNLASQIGNVEPTPSKEKRVKGKVYRTPKGLYRWTGDGWETAE